MSDLSSVAKANLESARQHDGKFGSQNHANPGQLRLGERGWDSIDEIPTSRRAEWQSHRFLPAEAVEWHTAGFEPAEAAQWHHGFFEPHEAATYRDDGIAELDARSFRHAGFDPAGAVDWRADGMPTPPAPTGVSSDEAQPRNIDRVEAHRIAMRNPELDVRHPGERQAPVTYPTSDPALWAADEAYDAHKAADADEALDKARAVRRRGERAAEAADDEAGHFGSAAEYAAYQRGEITADGLPVGNGPTLF